MIEKIIKDDIEQQIKQADRLTDKARKEFFICYKTGNWGDLKEYLDVYKQYIDYSFELRKQRDEKVIF